MKHVRHNQKYHIRKNPKNIQILLNRFLLGKLPFGKSSNWSGLRRNEDVGSSGDGRLPNAEPDRLAYRAACSSANKLITISFAEFNLERVNEASKNPKRLWTTIKSILHSSPPNKQLSPPIFQSLANSLAFFFYQKIVFPQGFHSLKIAR